MKKIGLSMISAAALGLCVVPAFGQLSTRENEASVHKLGARPVAGDMALTFSMNFTSAISKDSATGSASLFTGNFFAKGDFLTFKYYWRDDVAIRAAFRLSRKGFSSSGIPADRANSGLSDSLVLNAEHKEANREYVLVPGIEKHFTSSNIFDVYAGADLFIGIAHKDSTNNKKAANGDFDNYTRSSNNFLLGLGGVVGFNIFVAHLPISVGLEYGWNMRWDFGGAYSVKEATQSLGVSTSKEYEVSRDGTVTGLGTNKMKSLSESQMNMDTNQDVRLVINIYFGK